MLISYIKRYQMEHIYDYICLRFLKKNNNNFQRLEKICFLMQFESLNKLKKPMFMCKIYLEGNNIKIEYLSDIFRVMSPDRFGYHRFGSVKKMDKYIKMIRKYKNLTDEELDKKIYEILNNAELSTHYFIQKKYKNKKMRYYARMISRSNTHLGLNVLKTLLGLICFIVLILTPVLYCSLKVLGFEVLPLESLVTINNLIVILPILFLWVTWTCLWLQPTKYELFHKEIGEK